MVARFPFGRPWGEPNDEAQHRVAIEDALEFLRNAKEPGAIKVLPYRWRREDYAAILAERRAQRPSAKWAT